MHRLTMMAGALCVALLTSTGAFAQVPADPSNPNENVPEAQPNTPYGEPINLETAKKVAAAASAEAAKRKWAGMCIAVVGPSGDLVYFEKPDLCQYASVDISQAKARAAARYRRPTLVFERLMGKGPVLLLSADARSRLCRLARRQSARCRRQAHRRYRRVRRQRFAGRHDLASRRRRRQVADRFAGKFRRDENPRRNFLVPFVKD